MHLYLIDHKNRHSNVNRILSFYVLLKKSFNFFWNLKFWFSKLKWIFTKNFYFFLKKYLRDWKNCPNIAPRKRNNYLLEFQKFLFSIWHFKKEIFCRCSSVGQSSWFVISRSWVRIPPSAQQNIGRGDTQAANEDGL